MRMRVTFMWAAVLLFALLVGSAYATPSARCDAKFDGKKVGDCPWSLKCSSYQQTGASTEWYDWTDSNHTAICCEVEVQTWVSGSSTCTKYVYANSYSGSCSSNSKAPSPIPPGL